MLAVGESFANFSKRLNVQLHSLDVQSVKVSWLRGIKYRAIQLAALTLGHFVANWNVLLKKGYIMKVEDRADHNRHRRNIKSYSQKGFFRHLRRAPRTSLERKIWK